MEREGEMGREEEDVVVVPRGGASDGAGRERLEHAGEGAARGDGTAAERTAVATAVAGSRGTPTEEEDVAAAHDGGTGECASSDDGGGITDGARAGEAGDGEGDTGVGGTGDEMRGMGEEG